MHSVPPGSLAGVARVAWAMAEIDEANLDKIEKKLEAGNDLEALTLMRDYFHIKKEPKKAGIDERKTKNRTTKVRA